MRLSVYDDEITAVSTDNGKTLTALYLHIGSKNSITFFISDIVLLKELEQLFKIIADKNKE